MTFALYYMHAGEFCVSFSFCVIKEQLDLVGGFVFCLMHQHLTQILNSEASLFGACCVFITAMCLDTLRLLVVLANLPFTLDRCCVNTVHLTRSQMKRCMCAHL